MKKQNKQSAQKSQSLGTSLLKAVVGGGTKGGNPGSAGFI